MKQKITIWYLNYLQTYIGSILVAINPYKIVDAYDLSVAEVYDGQILGTRPP